MLLICFLFEVERSTGFIAAQKIVVLCYFGEGLPTEVAQVSYPQVIFTQFKVLALPIAGIPLFAIGKQEIMDLEPEQLNGLMNLDGSAAATCCTCCGALVKGSQLGGQLNNGTRRILWTIGQVDTVEIRRDALHAIMEGLCQYGLVAVLHEGYGKGVIAFIQRLLGQPDAMVLQQVIALII